MKKAILNMKAFYISLFVVLFFPLGLMGQTPVNTKIEPGSAVCFVDNENVMVVNVDENSNYVLSAEESTSTIWSIWWEITERDSETDLVVKSLIYDDCYLKINLTDNGNYYTTTKNVNEATNLWYVDAKDAGDIVNWLIENRLLGGLNVETASSWYIGSRETEKTAKYTYTDLRHWRETKGEYSYVKKEFFRPQYLDGQWKAVANNDGRKLNGNDFSSSSLTTIKSSDIVECSMDIHLGGVNVGDINIPIIGRIKNNVIYYCPPNKAQAYLLKSFNLLHQKGASAPEEYQIPIENLQPVHTHTEVIYATEDADVHLRLPVEDTKAYQSVTESWESRVLDDKYLNGYYRWFNFTDETDVNIINSSLKHTKTTTVLGVPVISEAIPYFETDKGDVLLKGFGPGKTTFKMGEVPVKIACDVSNYYDYDFVLKNDAISLIEPTLSYRVIYDIRPASEMANELDKYPIENGEALEKYNIVAPAGETIRIGPKYRWNGDNSNYFYTVKNSLTKIRNPYWFRKGSNGETNITDQVKQTLLDDRLISIVAPGDGKTETYVLKSTYEQGAIIAEFKVTGRAKEKVGPFKPEEETDFIHFPDYIDEDYLDPVYNQTFDFSARALAANPLPWDAISYGFLYFPFDDRPDEKSPYDNRGRKGTDNHAYMPHWSEYFFVSATPSDASKYPHFIRVPDDKGVMGGIKSHGKTYNTTEDRFLYCSSTGTPSKVVDFVINGNLCPASKIFLSAWVVHTYDISKADDGLSSEDPLYPNLNFSIIGIMKDGTETPISTFTTGDMKTNPGYWHHILFEFETTQVDYDQYRIRIENNNVTKYAVGNEFGIDDIRVYTTTKTAATVNQKFMGCPTWDVKNPTVIGKSNIALLRADLSNTPSENTTMYYSWLKSEGVNDTIHLQLENYLGTNTIGGSHTLYGDVEVKKDWTDNEVPSGRLYASVDEYLSVKDVDLKADVFVDYFFTREDGDLILYIVHKDILFQQNEKYYSLVTADKARVEEHNTPEKVIEFYQNLQCGSLSYFEVLPYSRAFLAKGTDEKYDYDFTEAITKHLAKGETYKFVVEAYSPVVIDGKDTIVSYNCAADWLLVNGMDEDEKWTNVESIIKWRKGEAAEPDLGNKLTKGVISKEITMSETEPFMHYVVIPCPGAPEDERKPCVVPFELLLYDSIPATLADPTINNNKVDVPDRPAAICNEPIVVRIPNSLEGKENIALNLDIDYFDEYLFAEIAKYNAQEGNTNLYPLNNIYLYDANGQQVATNITTTAKDKNNKPITLDLLKKDDDVAISGGHDFASGQKYHFAGHNQIDGVKITPPFQFDVYVVPDEVTWTGEQGTAWHNDDNWNPAFIPMSHTDVVIPGNTANKPVLKPTEGEFESGANQWLEHDIVFDIVLTKNEEDELEEVLVDNTSAVLNSCNDIYFAVGAELANQHMLNYERAFVDVPFAGDNFGKSTANYKIMSFPLRNVYRGDLYIPKAGDGSFAFASPADVDNRAYNSFYVKAYNSAIKKNTVSGDKTKPEAEKVVEVKDYTYESTEGWSNPTSVLNFEFEEAHGYAVSLNATTTQSFVRLPKSAEAYYLFMNFGDGNEKELPGSTWPKYEISGRESAHKLVYDKEHGASVTFTNKQGNIFLIGNPFMTGMSVEKFLEVNNLTSNVYYTYIDGIIEVDKMSNETDKKIPPFGAMFVQGKSTIQKFTFTSEMMSYTESSTSTQQRALRMVEERELLTITAEVDGARSRTYIEKDFAANNEYLDTEDADLLVLDADLTPISVYSVATGAALAYNSVTDMEFVPLGLLLVDSTIVAESVRFTFDGVDYFYDELYLYDALYNSYLPLIDGAALELEMPESGELRYFITDTKHNVGGGVTTSDDLVEGSKVCVFTTEGEACIIAEDIISEATVYDIAGRLIYYSDQISSSQHNISLPNGVYMLKVVVNSNLSTHKIILK